MTYLRKTKESKEVKTRMLHGNILKETQNQDIPLLEDQEGCQQQS